MMNVSITVTGPTHEALRQKMTQEIQSFLTGTPSGTVATVEQVNPASKVADVPAGFDSGEVLTLPSYSLTWVWKIEVPGEDGPVSVAV